MPWCHQGNANLGVVWAKAFYPEATVLVKALAVSHHLSLFFFFPDTYTINLLPWQKRQWKGKTKSKTQFELLCLRFSLDL